MLIKSDHLKINFKGSGVRVALPALICEPKTATHVYFLVKVLDTKPCSSFLSSCLPKGHRQHLLVVKTYGNVCACIKMQIKSIWKIE